MSRDLPPRSCMTKERLAGEMSFEPLVAETLETIHAPTEPEMLAA